MKILGINFGKQHQPIVTPESYQTYSTPFGKIGNGNLSLPWINIASTVNNYVWFGVDNLYPAIINQMYYTSPIHSSIVNFKINAVLGGGYELVSTNGSTMEDEVYLKTANITMRIAENDDKALIDLILHNRVYFKIHYNSGGDAYKFEYISADKVRRNKDGSVYYINPDWSRGNYETEVIPPYNKKNAYKCAGKCLLFCYEKFSVGQDVYPLPSYTSALNWCFLDGEMSALQKEYIVNGIFPSYVISFPQKPSTEEEKHELKKTIFGGRGSGGSGKIWTFFGRGKDTMPEIQTVPVSNLDNAFQATTESIDSKICQSHTIDPILMGIRVSGKLGSGSDIKQAYIVFEKNIVMPLREEIENIFNHLLKIAKCKGKYVVNEFQIIDDKISQVDAETQLMIDKFNALPVALQNKIAENMSIDELKSLLK